MVAVVYAEKSYVNIETVCVGKIPTQTGANELVTDTASSHAATVIKPASRTVYRARSDQTA